jgi:hypothetical protein
MRKILILSVFLVVVMFIAGCGGSNYSTTAGVVINKMEFDFPRISDLGGETAYLTIEMQNVGSKSMPGDGSYWIYGPTIGSDRNVWQLDGGIDDLVGVLDNDDFYPPEDGFPGAIESKFIQLSPPNIPQGMSSSYTFFTRVCYPYLTTAMFNVYSQSQEERVSVRNMDVRKVSNTDAQKRASAGPIQIEMNTQQDVRLSGDSLRLYFSVKDVGGGFATESVRDNCPSTQGEANVDAGDRGIVTLNVLVDGVPCEMGDNEDIEVRIRNGVGDVHCVASGDVIKNAGNNPNHEFTIVATAKYHYYIDAQTSIVVEDSPFEN